MFRSEGKFDYYSVFVHLMIVGLLVVVVVLSLQNKELKRNSGSGQKLDLLATGDSVSTFTVVSLDGKQYSVDYLNSTKKTLLFFFNTTCPACRENTQNWIDIWSSHDSDKVDIYPISLHKSEKTREYVKAQVLTYPVFVPKDSLLLKQYKLHSIPQTLLIDTKGKVEKNWIGILSPIQMVEIKNLIERR